MKPVLLALIALSLCVPVMAQDKLKPAPLRKPNARVMGMMAWEGKERVFLEIRVPRATAMPLYYVLMKSESADGVKVLSIDPDKGEVKLDVNGQVVSSVVPGWPAGPKANPPKKGFVTLSVSKAPLEFVLDVFGGLSGRTIIAPGNLPQMAIDLRPRHYMSKSVCLETIQRLVTAKEIGMEPLGKKFIRVLPLAQLDPKRIPKNGDAFLVVDEPPVEKGISAAMRLFKSQPDVVLNVFGDLTGRTIIVPVKLPQVAIDFKPHGPITEKDLVEAIQALLNVNGIGIKLHGDQTAFVLPASLLRHAPYLLGKMYANGQGHIKRPGTEQWIRMEKDEKKAVIWYAKAAEQYTKAAEQGNAKTQSRLAHMYRDGKGVEQDYAQAVKWFNKSVEQGDALGQAGLGYMYLAGKGVKKDFGKGLELYIKSAEQGFAQTQYQLGGIYFHGSGVKQDYGKAFEWYTKAANQGAAQAQYNLGGMYWTGQGTEKNMVKCLAWWILAAEQGAQYAIEWKPKALAEMTPDQIAKAEALAKEMNKSPQKPVPLVPYRP